MEKLTSPVTKVLNNVYRIHTGWGFFISISDIGRYISGIWDHIEYSYLTLYIYVCVCVCVRARACGKVTIHYMCNLVTHRGLHHTKIIFK